MKSFKIALSAVLGLSLLLAGCSNNNDDSASGKTSAKAGGADKNKGITVTLGIQPGAGPYFLARKKGWFEEEFAKTGAKVKWAEFQSGPPMTEAIAANRLDFAGLGNLPVVAAQAADIPFLEISQILDGKNNTAIIVPKDSKIQTVDDLKGKKIAVAKGSNAYNFLYRGLSQANLKTDDLNVIQLQPNEAQPAFETGGVDAWAVWDPYISTNVQSGKARILTDGEHLGVISPSFLIVRSKFAKEHPDLVVAYLKVYEKARLWEEQHFDETVAFYADELKVDGSIISAGLKRSKTINIPISQDTIDEQQKTADFQYSLKNIRVKIDTSKVVDNQYIEKALKETAAEAQK